jgi:hypothetical protein
MRDVEDNAAAPKSKLLNEKKSSHNRHTMVGIDLG